VASSLQVVILNQPIVYKNITGPSPQYVAVVPISGTVKWLVSDSYLAASNVITIHPNNPQQFIAASWSIDPKSQNITLSFAIYDMMSGLQLNIGQIIAIGPIMTTIQTNFSPKIFWFVVAAYAYGFDIRSAQFISRYAVPQPTIDVTIVCGDDGSTLQYDRTGATLFGQPGKTNSLLTAAA